MKRTILLFLGLVMAVAMMAQGRCLLPVHDTDGYANVRKGMSTKSAVVRRVKSGTDVYVSPTGSNWYRVSLSEGGVWIGYIYYDRVRLPNDFASLYKVTDKDGYTNVRLQATTKSQIVKRLKKGAEFQGLTCFVNGDYSNWVGVLDENERLIGFVYQANVECIAQ